MTTTIPEPYLCIKPACGSDCSGCNKAISAQTMRDYAIAHAAALAAPQPEPVAWVPVHPKSGPLWAMTTDKPDPERLPSYPLMSVFAEAPPAAPQPGPVAPLGWREALQFYADGSHFIMAVQDAWDTVSGEPTNFWCDEAGTATVEDGAVAKMALEGTPLPNEDDDEAAPPAAPAPAVPDEVLDSLGMHDAAVKLARRLGYTWSGGEWSAAPAVPVSWDRLRTLMDGIPTREEFIGGQRQKYVAKEAVMSWLHEGQLRAEREAAQPAAPAVQVVLRQPNLFASAPAVPLTDTRKLCTCDGAGRGPGRACVVQAGGRLGELWKCAKSAAPAVREPLTREQQIAIREAHCNTASDEYFGARPQIEDVPRRRIYEAGFKEGWESGIGGGGNG